MMRGGMGGGGGPGGGGGGGVSAAGGPWKDLMDRYIEKQQREAKKEAAKEQKKLDKLTTGTSGDAAHDGGSTASGRDQEK